MRTECNVSDHGHNGFWLVFTSHWYITSMKACAPTSTQLPFINSASNWYTFLTHYFVQPCVYMSQFNYNIQAIRLFNIPNLMKKVLFFVIFACFFFIFGSKDNSKVVPYAVLYPKHNRWQQVVQARPFVMHTSSLIKQ